MARIQMILELDTIQPEDVAIINAIANVSNGTKVVPMKPPVVDDTPQAPGPKPEKAKRTRRTKDQIAADKKAAEDAAAAKAEEEKAAAAKTPPSAPPPAEAPEEDDLVGDAPEEDDLVGDADHNVTMDDLRQALSAKVTDHRPAIKKKLTDLGVKKLTEIDKSGWPAMLEFLSNLD